MDKFILYSAAFFLFSLIGWILECIWCTILESRETKKFTLVNRGFLTGPLCPIYGAGALAIEFALRRFDDNLLVIFLLGIVVGDVIEYITSYVMEKIFNARWWDYSDKFLNINGRICLQHSIIWGLLCVTLIKYISPFIFDLLSSVPSEYLTFIIIVTLFLFIIDLVIAVVATMDIKILRSKIKSIVNETEKPEIEIVEIGCSNTNSISDRISDFKNKVNSISFTRRMNIRRLLREMPLVKEQVNNQFNQLKNSVDISDELKEVLKKMKDFFLQVPEKAKKNKNNKNNKKDL